MTTLGRVALRDFAMVRQGYTTDPDGANIPGGWVGSGVSVFPDALSIMRKAHDLPSAAPYLPTGMLVPFTPEIATFTPGDEDVGSYANAFDQTITSRMASCTFSTDGMSYEDMKELCECFGTVNVDGRISDKLPFPETVGSFPNNRTTALALPRDDANGFSASSWEKSIRQRMGFTDGFQTWSFLWQDGLEKGPLTPEIARQIYVMPLAFVSNIRIQAGIRREIGMTASAVAREVIEVANVRDWELSITDKDMDNLERYYAPNYPDEIFTPAPSSDRPASTDTGIGHHQGTGPNPAIRELKHRFISAGIEIYLDNTGSTDQPNEDMHRIESENVAMTIDLSTGLTPSWRFGDLAFRQGIRARRGMMLSLDFVNDNKGREQFRRFLSVRRKVQKIWIVFYDPERRHRMVIESYIRLVNVGQLPSDDGQWADVFPLMYQSVGIKPSGSDEVYLEDNESDFALHFGARSTS